MILEVCVWNYESMSKYIYAYTFFFCSGIIDKSSNFQWSVDSEQTFVCREKKSHHQYIAEAWHSQSPISFMHYWPPQAFQGKTQQEETKVSTESVTAFAGKYCVFNHCLTSLLHIFCYSIHQRHLFIQWNPEDMAWLLKDSH